MSSRIYDDRGEGSERPPRASAAATGSASNASNASRGPLGRLRKQIRRFLAYLGAFAVLVIVALSLSTGGVLAASPSPAPSALAAPASAATSAAPTASSSLETLPPGPDHVLDPNRALSPAGRTNAASLIQQIEDVTNGTVYVYVQRAGLASNDEALTRAGALLAQWLPQGLDKVSAVLVLDVSPTIRNSHAGLATAHAFVSYLPDDERQAIVDDSMSTYLANGNLDEAVTAGLSRLDLDVQVMAGGGCVGNACPTLPPGGPAATAGASAGPNASPARTPRATATPRPTASAPTTPAGPPYPPPVTGKRVYDFAGVFKLDTVAKLQATADAIEQRTGAQVVVYTQIKPGVDTSGAERDAIALIDQWGIGRKGFDDGLVILFDLDRSLRHGQVQLYAGPGFRAAFLTNAERQAIYDNEMLPYLKAADLDSAALIAMRRIDEAASQAHAQSLQNARQTNAAIGLVGAPLVFLLLAGWALLTWFRHGRDPHYLDDPSIYVAGPPANLTPASAAFVLDGGSSRRALTTALLDLASRGEMSFKEAGQDEAGRVGIDVEHGLVDAPSAAIASARPLGAAETMALHDLRSLGRASDGYLVGSDLQRFSSSVEKFNTALEQQVVAGGWYAQPPRIARNKWLGRGVLEIFGAFVVFFIASAITSSGVTLVAGALLLAGIVTFVLAFSMPAKTMAGAMVEAMLAGYRRTLAKTMENARSLNEVVSGAQLPWLRTPDQAMVWGTALGLQSQLASVLQRSLTDVAANHAIATTTYFPTWYVAGSALGLAGGSGGAGVSEPSGGLFSNSMVPDFGSMLAALGTIGNAPPSTSSSSGGGSFSSGGSFGGGSSGGGGGGAGGGF